MSSQMSQAPSKPHPNNPYSVLEPNPYPNVYPNVRTIHPIEQRLKSSQCNRYNGDNDHAGDQSADRQLNVREDSRKQLTVEGGGWRVA